MTKYDEFLTAIVADDENRSTHDFTKDTIAAFQLAADDILDSFNEYLDPVRRKAERDSSFVEHDKSFSNIGRGLYANKDKTISFGICIPFWEKLKRLAPSCSIRAGLRPGKPQRISGETWSLTWDDGNPNPDRYSDAVFVDLDVVMWLPEDSELPLDQRASLRLHGIRYGLPSWPLDKSQSRGLGTLYSRIVSKIQEEVKALRAQ
jgi:hypothetical protein